MVIRGPGLQPGRVQRPRVKPGHHKRRRRAQVFVARDVVVGQNRLRQVRGERSDERDERLPVRDGAETERGEVNREKLSSSGSAADITAWTWSSRSAAVAMPRIPAAAAGTVVADGAAATA